MSFTLGSCFFVLIVFLLFYLIRRRARAYFLLISSLLFIGYLDIRSFIWVVVVTAIVYLLGLIESRYIIGGHVKSARFTGIVGVIACVFSLFVLKYVAKWSPASGLLAQLVLPIGFSYYIFQAIAYLVDILKGKVKAEKNLFFFALYMCFFPKFISGPIEEPNSLLSQIKQLNNVYLKDDHNLSIAFPTILYGLFMKVVVADRLGMFTAKLFAQPQQYGFLMLFAGMLMYTLQIYCDFSGYSALAVGISKIFGINLIENFFAPYFSRNMSEFWRRWHISLSNWLRDYIYIPLGGSRKGNLRRYFNILVVFVVCGMWHGVGGNFFVWGLLHGIFSIIGIILADMGKRSFPEKTDRKTRIAADTVVTFLCAAFAWIFFGAQELGSALTYVGRMLTFKSGDASVTAQARNLGFTKVDFVIPIYVVIVILFDILMIKKKLPIGKALYTLPQWARYTIEYLLIMTILLLGIYGPGFDQTSFMYMQF